KHDPKSSTIFTASQGKPTHSVNQQSYADVKLTCILVCAYDAVASFPLLHQALPSVHHLCLPQTDLLTPPVGAGGDGGAWPMEEVVFHTVDDDDACLPHRFVPSDHLNLALGVTVPRYFPNRRQFYGESEMSKCSENLASFGAKTICNA
ncbi:hypothetical protein P5673_031955, partial [Acropora cervicornis]